ncbi:MAG TPA: hypothetical protein ENN69_05115 [Spirochaetia bacterium]|nr:hypothetical protein [Spirochaetia bacterium]
MCYNGFRAWASKAEQHARRRSFPAFIKNRASLLLGHTRWRTRGDERVNRNNHPIRAGDVIGTHNGTIYNADYLCRLFKLRRFAEVDDRISDFGLGIADYLRERAVFMEATTIKRISIASFFRSARCFSSINPASTIGSIQMYFPDSLILRFLNPSIRQFNSPVCVRISTGRPVPQSPCADIKRHPPAGIS